jgi:ferric-dicitrate binding protein FerR (iron transport regulator)
MVSYTAMAEQNGIRLYGDTVLAVDKLVASNTGVDALTDTELDLRQGTIFGCIKKLSAASQFVIKMPNAAAAVRGTTFVLSANGVITVIDGSCVISAIVNGKTVTQVVNAGEQFDPATGQVTQLTQAQIVAAKQTAVEVITVVKGIISFEDDRTIVYVSPVHGNPGRGHHHWWWPF